MAAAWELVRQAQAVGLSSTSQDGSLRHLTSSAIEAALDVEMSEHLGCDKHAVGAATGAIRPTEPIEDVLSDAVFEVPIEVRRDRDGTFAPKIMAKQQRRLSSLDGVVLSLYPRG